MSATRPQNVPSIAVCVPPNGVGTPPGWDPQLAVTIQFEAMVSKQNYNNGFVYAGAYNDWKANASQYAALGLPVPPAPVPPPVQVANVVWADSAGNEHTTRESGDNAWQWQSQAAAA